MKRIIKTGNHKVAIIGSGYVGSSIAYALALRDIGSIIPEAYSCHLESR